MQPTVSAVRAPARVPVGATPEGDGIVLGNGPVRVDAYIDFLCPFCRQFEERSGPYLDRLLDAGAISLVYHPLGFLDRLSTTRYSSRASATSGCAADYGHFREYKDLLFANQPEEGGPGLSQEELIELGAEAGITDQGFPICAGKNTYLPWTEYVTTRAVERGVSGTPSVFVVGVPVPANGPVIAAAVAEVAP
jgi:protein-disulfide isomerase